MTELRQVCHPEKGRPVFHTRQKNYYSLRELAGAFSASNKNWEDAIFQLKNGGVEKWLEISGEYDASKKINKIFYALSFNA